MVATPSEVEATRTRLIEAAGEVFSSEGFQSATVRDICIRAGANVAAVNYHFRDKMGLYVAVLKASMSAAGPETLPDAALATADPEQALRRFISGMLHRMSAADERAAWHMRIMAHEVAHPTEALPQVAKEIIGPKYEAIRKVIGRIIALPPGHETTRLCAHSVIGQVIHYAHGRPVIACLWPELKITPASLNKIANHIAEFSLCSLRAIKAEQNAGRTTR